MAKLHIGMMFFVERELGEEALKSRIMGKYELLLLDGREVDRKRYPKLYSLLQANNLDGRLPSDQREEDIQDHYIIARHLSKQEIAFVKECRRGIEEENK